MHPERYDALLSQLHGYAPLYPKYGVNLANHAPMVLDVLWELGAEERAEAWLAESITSLAELPHGKTIPLRERPSALGDGERTADWVATFDQELAAQGVERTLRVVLPLLTPGALAASLHGLLRTAHALRAFARGATPVRRREVAHGLASWAANFQLLPGLERPLRMESDRSSALGWLDSAPLLSDSERIDGLLHEIVRPLGESEAWREHLRRLGPLAYSERALHEVAAWSAQRLARDPHGSNAHLHGVTVSSSLVWFEPWLDRSQLDALLRQVVLALGAVHAASASYGSSECSAGAPLPPSELRDQALASGDDHALKLTEAVLRIQQRGLVTDPWLARGAERWVRRAYARRVA